MRDRWMVSCLGCLWLSKELFYRVVPADQAFSDKNIVKSSDDYAGIFRFRLWWCGEWREVLVDDRLPTVNGRLVFLHSQHSDQYWASLLEKAYAKLHGSYEALKYGTTLDGFADLTGGITESMRLRQDPTSCSRILSKLLQMTSIITVNVQSTTQSRSQSDKLANGIQIGLNYRVYSIEKVETYGGEPVQLVRLRAPGLVSEYIGAWSKSSLEWDEVPPTEIERLGIKQMAEGEFWMPYADFLKTYTHMEVIHLDQETSKDEASLRNKSPWNVRQYQGSWMRGVTAGGCRNNADTFHINPQLHLLLSDMEEVVLSLNQHAIMDPRVIGFTVYPVLKNTDSIGKSFFKKNKSLINSQYTNSRQVSQRCQLEQGAYLVLPTTFEPGQEASFTFRVYSNKALKLRVIDTTPSLSKSAIMKASPIIESKNFQQYEAVFLQLADEHRTISAFELQELLEACLPNDYIKSCATLDVCRQVIIAMDKTGMGRLKFSQFKDLMFSLKSWQSTFKGHTKEKTGILKAERLRDCLGDMGFQLNNEIMSVVVLRFMRKDGTLRFGDFVGAILHLTVAFSIFDKKDPLMNGSLKLNLSEWIKLSLMC
ncbi:Calpain-C [Orchesella cincta]|uniref:Calpain-C n=1 Tax=Orchesella cincta TaxID=48709 RepID=A0A1D2NIP3_ORCCI|nr:Calpain-C [Orchesella cincta]